MLGFSIIGLLKSREFWIVIGCMVVAGVLIHLGDRYGSNARLVARYAQEITDKNAKIAEMTADDAQRALREQIEEAANSKRFNAAKKMKCIIDKETADALNGLIGD